MQCGPYYFQETLNIPDIPPIPHDHVILNLVIVFPNAYNPAIPNEYLWYFQYGALPHCLDVKEVHLTQNRSR